MSDKPSEYLKRTCLICGCHTNQTINIYEPRSGPNIVELIQAKFKFQPLNEDKYLCFSCNNWLINWHSLQALNSNDAESPSGTFRSHLSSSSSNISQEKGGAGSQHSCSRSIFPRPIARVRPQQLTKVQIPTASITTLTSQEQGKENTGCNKRTSGYYKCSRRYNKRTLRRTIRNCILCGRLVILRRNTTRSRTTVLTNRKTKSTKCRKCCEIIKCVKYYLHKQKQQLRTVTQSKLVNSNNSNSSKLYSQINSLNQPQYQQQHLGRPLVDGKVVSMLRRLGTTLSRESISNSSTTLSPPSTFNNNASAQTTTTAETLPPPIMSPTKDKPRWTRQLEDDEILLNFNTAISEVLPIIDAAKELTAQSVDITKQVAAASRKRLTYQISSSNDDVIEVIDSDVNEQDDKENESIFTRYVNVMSNDCIVQDIYNVIPAGLSISLISK